MPGDHHPGPDPVSLTLYDYWRSSAAYRVRIGLHLKGAAFDQVAVNLLTGAHREAEHLARNPQGLAPALNADGVMLIQSGAILEWLDERFPAPPLLPADADGRAQVRAMAAIIGSDIHPINNLRVLKHLRGPLAADEAEVTAWIGQWIGEGFTALETLIAQHGGAFAFGDTPTLADCFLIPQIYSARRYNVDLEAYPLIRRINDHALTHPAFIAAHPDNQPDAPG